MSRPPVPPHPVRLAATALLLVLTGSTMSGCVAATLAGAAVGVGAAAVGTTAKVGGAVVGAAADTAGAVVHTATGGGKTDR